MASLTILVCTHNRIELLRRALASLNAAERPLALDVEILVIANSCRDGTHRFLERYRAEATAEPLPMRWAIEPRPGKSNALNAGLAMLRGDWVAIVDDDHRVASDFLVNIDEAVRRYPQASALCGRVLPDWDGSEPGWVHDQGRYRVYPLPIPRQDFGCQSRQLGSGGPLPGGGNQIFRTDLLRRVGRFTTAMGPRGHDLGGGEDTEFLLRALREDACLWYIPGIVQYHYVDPARLALPYLMRKAYKRSAASVGLRAERLRRGVPLYLVRKIVVYSLSALMAWGEARRRFFLVRASAALGEVAGHLRPRSVRRLAGEQSAKAD